MSDSKNILIVDDNEDQIVFVSQILEDNGYTHTACRNGADALAELKKNKPALVILDIMMPRKSGLNVLQEMRKDADLNSIPVIISSGASEVTGVDMNTGNEKAKETYGDDLARGFGEVIRDKLQELKPEGFIEKPVDPPVLIAKIKELLN